MRRAIRSRPLTTVIIMVVGLGACSGPPSTSTPRDAAAAPEIQATRPPSPTASDSPKQARKRPELPEGVSARPAWLGERVLPENEQGFGIVRATPKLLRDRRLVSLDLLPPPRSHRFSSSSGPVPKGVLQRSTWNVRCPVKREDLSYLTMSFWGFDREPHTGELIVHTSVARDVVSVFKRLYRARWPIEEMRVTETSELDAPPTGDGNNTSAFVCRPARLSDEWSEHAYGLAIDINPFHNPYVRDDLVLPERALAYVDRDWRRPGMIRAGDVVTRAFADIGWEWGGSWSSAKDWMHFSRSGA